MIIKKMPKRILIHIGKCGGSTIGAALRENGIIFDKKVHIRQPPINLSAEYYIIARDPISRAISAFNWRYHLVNSQEWQKNRFPGEFEILNNYQNLNSLAERLYFPNGGIRAIAQGNYRSIHHLGEGISFYLYDLLQAIPKENVAGVIMQETLNEDLNRLFNISTNIGTNRNRHIRNERMLSLSEKARYNLRRFLEDDYKCIGILNRWKKLNPDCLQFIDKAAYRI